MRGSQHKPVSGQARASRTLYATDRGQSRAMPKGSGGVTWEALLLQTFLDEDRQ